ncbi:MAG: enoyl-CoA hydratase/isomerase family protein, partial [Desulfobacteraceae bacterium]
MDNNVLINEEKDGTAILTLNWPKAMNSLNFDLLYAIRNQIESLQYRPEIRTVIITGTGEKAFCAGADLK